MKFDPKQLKSVAGTFPTGVTIVTITEASGEVHGMTASSLQSVSLDPPLVSFCVKENAKTYQLLEEGTPIGISILNNDQQDISSQFAGYGDEEAEIKMMEHGNKVRVIDKALGWYATIVDQIIPAGDHFLILCRIQEFGKKEEGQPLVYWSGYKTITEITNSSS